MFNRILSLADGSSAGRKARRKGNRARDAGDWPEARKAFTRYLTHYPDDWAIRVQLGHAQKACGDLAAAEQSYHRAVALAPAEPDPVLQLGYLMQMSGRIDEAIECFEQVSALGSERAADILAELLRERNGKANSPTGMLRARKGTTGSPVGLPRDRKGTADRSHHIPHLNHYRAMLAGFPHQVWIGRHAPDGMEEIDLHGQVNFRAPGYYHSRFQVVWLFEHLLSDLPQSRWTILVDEAIRLLGEEGRLVVRHEQNDNMSLMLLRSVLARRPGIQVTMEPHLIEDGRIINCVFTIRREQIDQYRNKSWSFIILAQGNRTANVIALLDRLRAIGREISYEVIIVGPNLEEYSGYDVLVFNRQYRDDYAQIALKKNDAAKFASNANLCIMHDRFVLEEDFFSGFETFGYDFDFVAVRQRYITGEAYPFYAELGNRRMIWSVPTHTTSYQDFRPTHYVNGGFMVFKRVMFDTISFNPLLAWNEAEDVEISDAFAARNIPPRVNLSSTVVTTVSTAHTAMFLPDLAT